MYMNGFEKLKSIISRKEIKFWLNFHYYIFWSIVSMEFHNLLSFTMSESLTPNGKR